MLLALAGTLAVCGCRSAAMATRAGTENSAAVVASAAAEQRSTTGQSRSEETRSGQTRLESAEVADHELVESAITQVSAQTADDATPGQLPSSTVVAPMRLSVRQAIETALAQNPDLVAQRQAEGVSSAALGVAQTYPFNPWVQVQATPYQDARVGGPGTTSHYVLLMQQLQLAGQQQHREEVACAALNGVRWTLLQAELLNVAQTQRLYFAALYQQGLRDLARANAENNQQLLTILERQLAAGQATAADAGMVRLDARSTRQQLQLAEANLQTALLDLRRQLGLPHHALITLDGEVTRWNWAAADGDQLAAQAASRPDVMAAHADIDAARANTNLAHAARTPDLQIGPYYQRNDSGTNFLGFRAQMDLPVINNGMPLVRQREAELSQRAVAWQQLVTRASLEAQAAADRYERARQMLLESRDRSGSELPVELRRLEEQFKAGEVDVLRVMQARNSLIQSQRADLDTLNEVLLSATAVTAAAGVPLESLGLARQ